MTIDNQELLSAVKDFDYWGVPIDAGMRQKVIEANRTLEIMPAGEMIIYVKTTGFDVMMNIYIENLTRRNLHIAEIAIKLPFLVNNFRWLPKLTPKLAREQGYILPHSSCGPFFPPDVLNHFTRDIRVLPGVGLQGVLLGSSVTPVPEEDLEQELMPAQLTMTTSTGRSVHRCFSLCVVSLFEPKPARVRRRSLLAMRDPKPVG